MLDATLVDNASRALTQLLDIRAGENFLIVTDEATQVVAQAFEQAARQAGAQVIIYRMNERVRPLREVPEDLAALIPDADLAVTCFRGRAEETPFRVELIRALTRTVRRLGHAPGITEAMLREGPMNVDYDAMRREAMDLMARLDGAGRVHVTAPGGTDLVLDITGRSFETDTYVADGGWGNLPAGEVWCAPVEDSANGVVVCDGSIGDLGPVPSPVRLRLEAGRIVRIECADAEFQRRVEEVLAADEEARVIGELGIGLNPGARLTGNLLEDEKARHTAHVAFGNNEDMPGGRNRSRTHRDFLFHRPTILLRYTNPDREEMLMKDGDFVERNSVETGGGAQAARESAAGTDQDLPAYRHILVAVDFSDSSRTALRVAHAMARRNGARLSACCVIPRPISVSPLFPHYVATPDTEALRREEGEVQARLSDLVFQETRRDPSQCAALVTSGQPGAEIVRLAEEHGADLIVVASRGMSRLARMVLGSVAESVARHAHCHVLVVR